MDGEFTDIDAPAVLAVEAQPPKMSELVRTFHWEITIRFQNTVDILLKGGK